MKRGIYLLPNGITLCGMSCGFYAIIAATKGDFVSAAWAILVADFFDGMDGFIARLTHSSSKFGIQLDSLSDLVAFCVAPAIILYAWRLNQLGRLGWAASFFFVMCGALRLARYNVQMDSTESKAFTGMPTPGAATIVALFVIFHFEELQSAPNSYLTLALAFLLGLLMVSTIKYHGLKEINLKGRKPFIFLVALVIIIVLISVNPPLFMFLLSIAYMTWGITEAFYVNIKKLQQKRLAKQDNNSTT